MSPVRRLTALGIAGTVLIGLGMPLLRGFGDDAFLALACAGGVIAALAAGTQDTAGSRALAVIVGAGLAMRLLALSAPPILSTDIFRYVWDGMVQGAGINPYRYVPADPSLAFLRDAQVYPFINRADYAVTIYPPVAQAFFFLVTRFSASPLAIKVALVACEGVTICALIGLLRLTGQPETRVAAYAWHPLPVWEIAGEGHVDGLMIALMMLGLWLALAVGRRYAGAASVVLAALAKPFALIALPGLWRPWDWRMVALVPVVMALAYLPYLSVGSGVLGFLATGYADEQGLSSGSGFTLLRLWRQSVGEWPHDTQVYLAVCLVILTVLALRTGFRRSRTPERSLCDINGSIVMLLFLLSPEFPWYLLMAVPFLSLAATLPGWVLTVGGFMLYDVVPGDPQLSYDARSAILAALVAAAALVQVRIRRRPGLTR
ncbi:glycosyltransferase 87 family protein [Methylobacterium sp. J-088]|uniref:glycosyltransferase 87 family protein n=1 Tax=Methylobacterium sp. J-088 TaxID=2836664 RepID=UPI001FBB5227|nr:glycosyltransferase 87 family protein [Methylobacterium sp. J-088]MCJ2063718.1 glycosyltransferase 87 family protein [Methylobacterium sp. J-088]